MKKLPMVVLILIGMAAIPFLLHAVGKPVRKEDTGTKVAYWLLLLFFAWVVYAAIYGSDAGLSVPGE